MLTILYFRYFDTSILFVFHKYRALKSIGSPPKIDKSIEKVSNFLNKKFLDFHELNFFLFLTTLEIPNLCCDRTEPNLLNRTRTKPNLTGFVIIIEKTIFLILFTVIRSYFNCFYCIWRLLIKNNINA